MTDPTSNNRRRRRALWDPKWPDHPQLAAEVTLTVPFQDADPTGMAWHGNYFRYYDSARVALLAKLNFAYRQMEALGQFWPIVDSRVRYTRSVAYDDTICVRAQLVEWEFRLRIYYQIHNADGTPVNEGWTVQVPVGIQRSRPESNEALIVGSPESLLKDIETLLADAPE